MHEALPEWLLYGGAGATLLVTLGVLTRSIARALLKVWRRVDSFLSDWNGEPARPGRNAVPSMPERITNLETRFIAIEDQITPNGGNTKSLGDRVARIGTHLGTE